MKGRGTNSFIKTQNIKTVTRLSVVCKLKESPKIARKEICKTLEERQWAKESNAEMEREDSTEDL